ncbi:ATP-dependent helicase [Zoogloea oleivorans]|uniref:DNA 3'-5' helicase n=1 Tax=Zoogloea oleivorans TaxID=1552750 RepID=A0A6C2CKC6_9RHOO|nr:ATP-dependent helicase [Zoogloea oleivorans]TYC53962.1 ATP-dependent helicase [Zoogloea oleivorans]
MTEKNYTKEQIKVIEHDGGHAVVAAVAGSGKTETLIGRVRHLLRDYQAHQIVVIMFNRDARESFARRFEQAVQVIPPEIRTFNSMGNKIVQRFVQIGMLSAAEIVEKDYRRTNIARQVFTSVFKQLNSPDMTPDKELIDDFVSFILLVKSDIRSAEAVFEDRRYGSLAAGYPTAFQIFEQERKRQKIRFFEDQIYDPVMLMLKEPETQRYVANKVDHLIIDEAQDMNGIQVAMLRILAGTRAKVMLVGDEDQAIYEWRGAKPDYLVGGFEKDFSNATRYTLPHTFRFGHLLSVAASQVVSYNTKRNSKISISAEGTPKTRIHCLPLSSGLTGLGEHIRKVLNDGYTPSDIAVLVRTYSLSVALELELHHLRIPHYIYGRPPLGRIPEIRALVGVLQMACGRWTQLEPLEMRHMIECLLQRPGLYLDKDTVKRVATQVMNRPEHLSAAIRGVITPKTKSYHADQIRDRADLLEIIATSTNPSERVIDVLERYLIGTSFVTSIEKQASTKEAAEIILANVVAFKTIANHHQGSIEEFLDEIDPLIDTYAIEPPKAPHVWIGSIHRAKGDQWPVVFVPGLVERSFPPDHLDTDEIEAERRLFYVGVTRAIDELYLAHPDEAEFRKNTEQLGERMDGQSKSSVSRFLWEMNIALAKHAGLAVESAGPFRTATVYRPDIAHEYFKHFSFASTWSYTDHPNSLMESPRDSPLAEGPMGPGARVRHEVYGLGKIDRWVDKRVVRIIFDDGEARMFVANSQIKVIDL